MLLLVHIVSALTSLVLTLFLNIFPSKKKLRIAYFLVATTLVSGIYLIWSHPTHALSATVSGLTYVAAETVGIVFAQKRLAKKLSVDAD